MKRILTMLMVLVLVLGVFSGCVTVQEGPAPADAPAEEAAQEPAEEPAEAARDSVTIIDTEWIGTDLFQIAGISNSQNLISDTLLLVDDNGNYLPNICESYELAEDGSSITFVIPTDFMWADGTVLTPEDVKRSLEHGLEVAPYSFFYNNITEITVDGQNVVCTLDGYKASALYAISQHTVPILPASQIDSMSNEDLLWNATPYGPYYLDEYVEGQYVTLKRNPNYKTNNPTVTNQGPSNVETVTIKFLSDTFAIANSIKEGEIDLAFGLSTDQIEEIDALDDYSVAVLPGQTVLYLMLNSNDALLENADIRLALMHGIDRESLYDLSGGYVSANYIYSPTFAMSYSQEAADYNKETFNYDPEKAAQLLEGAGWTDSDGDGYLDKDGQKLSVSLSTYDAAPLNTVATMLQIMLKDIGVELVLDYSSDGAELLTNDTYQAILSGLGWGDASGALPLIDQDVNWPELDLDAFNEKLNQGITTTDEAERIALFTEVQKMMFDTLGHMPVCVKNVVVVTKDGVFTSDMIDCRYNIKITDVK